MKTRTKIIAASIAALATVGVLAGCSTSADTTSYNLSQKAENFEVQRRITFINGITDREMLIVEGLCSVETNDSMLAGAMEVTCKIGPDAYKKNFLYLSDNVTATVEQLETTDVSAYHYLFIIRPETLVPEFQLDTGKQ